MQTVRHAGGRGNAPFRAVVLDIGGVLAATPPTGWQEAWERHLGLRAGELDRRIDDATTPGTLGLADEGTVRDGVASALGLHDEDVDALFRHLWTEYVGTLHADLLAFVSSLRPRVKVGLLSNSLVGAREREEAAFGFSRHVDDIVYSHEVGLAKPDPAVYRMVCDRLDVAPEEAVFVDDHAVCTDAAAALGMHAVRFTTEAGTIRAIEDALAGGAVVMPSGRRRRRDRRGA